MQLVRIAEGEKDPRIILRDGHVIFSYMCAFASGCVDDVVKIKCLCETWDENVMQCCGVIWLAPFHPSLCYSPLFRHHHTLLEH